ncbi:hypothetical protein LIER_23886 [Lithospermum erythrorhizon]|uniref:Vacuolar protein sorting-associated protein 51 homolog n=1 Tax=Lithospermum erythrorhizon TaxID=34254 RepID=A0AAV3QZ51_LITER
MGREEEITMDDKAKRMRDLLSSFYSAEESRSPSASSRFATLDTINTSSFDPDQYMNLLVHNSNMEGLLKRHLEMAAEIQNLDTDLQMLVYQNYNKFISATDTIKRMKNNIVGMESNMEQLLHKITSVQSRSDGVNTSLFGKREHIEKLHRSRNLLHKIQFIYDLPARLQKCIQTESYADAVKFYTGSLPIFKAYGDSSYRDCKRSSEEAVATIVKNLQGKVFSDSESIQTRAEAVLLLKQLNVPVDSLKLKLFEKLEQFLADLHLESQELPLTKSPNNESICEFAEAVRAYRAIFPDSEQQLFKLAQALIMKQFEAIHHHLKKNLSSTDFLGVLRVIWMDVLLMDEVLPEASLADFCLEATRVAIEEHIASTFSHLLHDISEILTKVGGKEGEEEKCSLEATYEASKSLLLQRGVDILLDLHQLHDDSLELLIKIRDQILVWVQEGFHDFFRNLNDYFLLFSGKKYDKNPPLTKGMLGDKVHAGLVLVLAQLSIFIERNVIPKITEEIEASFSDGWARGYEYGPGFIPAEIRVEFRSASNTLLLLYISLRNQKISALLKKRFTATNWTKHKEPREVHMFLDLLLQELEAVRSEVSQILPKGIQGNRILRTASNGSGGSSSFSNQLGRSNSHRARSQLLESHVAKLFKQKIEIFTKVEHTQDSVRNSIIKTTLKSLQEFVRLQTFNRSGFQQIQLDTRFLSTTLNDTAEEEGTIDLLLDEVVVAAAERCLDPIPLENAILDKLINAKLAKNSPRSPTT